jgi:hypothetical protein
MRAQTVCAGRGRAGPQVRGLAPPSPNACREVSSSSMAQQSVALPDRRVPDCGGRTNRRDGCGSTRVCRGRDGPVGGYTRSIRRTRTIRILPGFSATRASCRSLPSGRRPAPQLDHHEGVSRAPRCSGLRRPGGPLFMLVVASSHGCSGGGAWRRPRSGSAVTWAAGFRRAA